MIIVFLIMNMLLNSNFICSKYDTNMIEEGDFKGHLEIKWEGGPLNLVIL